MSPARRATQSLLRAAGRALAMVVLLVTAGCLEDEIAEPVLTPEPGGDLFQRYVALGNSITAGFQSGGISDSTQQRAYPVLLAEGAGADFTIPLLSDPGCPPPFVEAVIESTRRIGDAADDTCGLRSVPAPRFVQNLAVPGARIATLLDASVASNALTFFILGGRTQIERMQEVDPTLVSIWIGNNDAIDAAVTGQAGNLTPVADFEESLGEVVAAVRESTAREAILIGVVNPLVVPALQPGAYFWAAQEAARAEGEELPVEVLPDCSPESPVSRNVVSVLAFQAEDVSAISCDPDDQQANQGLFLLTEEEQAAIAARVDAFNTALSSAAEANNWVYIDPNQILGQFRDNPERLRKCQGLAPENFEDLPPEEFERAFFEAVAETCPDPDAENPFGSLISLDAIHPSSEAHRLVADAIAAALNAAHGLDLPTS